MQPQGLHGDSTEGFFVKNLYCLECTYAVICLDNIVSALCNNSHFVCSSISQCLLFIIENKDIKLP